MIVTRNKCFVLFLSSVQQLVALGVAQELDLPHGHSSELKSSLYF